MYRYYEEHSGKWTILFISEIWLWCSAGLLMKLTHNVTFFQFIREKKKTKKQWLTWLVLIVNLTGCSVTWETSIWVCEGGRGSWEGLSELGPGAWCHHPRSRGPRLHQEEKVSWVLYLFLSASWLRTHCGLLLVLLLPHLLFHNGLYFETVSLYNPFSPYAAFVMHLPQQGTTNTLIPNACPLL